MRTRRLIESHVRDHASAEKRRHAPTRSVEKLIGDYEIEWRQIIAQRSHSAHRNNPLHSQHLECANIRAVIDFAWSEPVPAPMPRKESHAAPLQQSRDDRVRGFAE